MKRINIGRLLSDYGNVLVLLLLCIVASLATIREYSPTSASAARRLAEQVSADYPKAKVLVLVHKGKKGTEFAETLKDAFEKSGFTIVQTVVGKPLDARIALEKLGTAGVEVNIIAAENRMARFCQDNLRELAEKHSSLANAQVSEPASYRASQFLKTSNLLNILKQISIVAIIAIGMTMVIITAGIDLSVGSLIAFSGVITALVIQQLGGESPNATHLLLGAAAGIFICAFIGMGVGGLVTLFNIPAFIVTLGVMFIAKGLAFILSKSEPVSVANEAFGWLGRGQDFLGLHNSVVLMFLLYAVAHVVMTYTSIGRYIYAVGGNPEAARLSGVPVKWVLVFVYTLCGLLAGLGGVMEASLHITGDPKSGTLVELQVIAAVVVGGTSLAGGQGKIFGTLIGALIIGVIRNGMNLTGVEAHMQSVVYGAVILIAVLVDQLKNRSLRSN